MRLLDVLRGGPRTADPDGTAVRGSFGVDWYAQQLQSLQFGGLGMPAAGLVSTLPGSHEDISHSYVGYVSQAYQSNGVVFACEALRTRVFSEAGFAWQRKEQGRRQEMFTDRRLRLLEKPWPGGTTQDLLQRMLLSADLGGNCYVCRNRHGHLRILRPDWVTIVRGSDIDDPDADPDGIDAQLLGYLYRPGGPGSRNNIEVLLPSEVSHFAPDPDPLAMYRGMSWITPLVREVEGDSAMSQHKNQFLANAATPNLVVRLDASVTPKEFKEFKAEADAEHTGLLNAYRTMYLGGGADVTVAGANMQQLDFKVVQGHGETRIAAAAGIHPVVVGLSEGMQGSSLNAGNYSQARRNVADTTFHPLWRNVAGSLQTIIRPGDTGADLVADVRDVPFLRNDERDAAEIQARRATTINNLIREGWTADSAKEYVKSDDLNQLEHTGLVSVQLRIPGAGEPGIDDGETDGGSGGGGGSGLGGSPVKPPPDDLGPGENPPDPPTPPDSD